MNPFRDSVLIINNNNTRKFPNAKKTLLAINNLQIIFFFTDDILAIQNPFYTFASSNK